MICGNVNHYNNSEKQHGGFLEIKTRILILSNHPTAGYRNPKEVYYIKGSKTIISHIIYMHIYSIWIFTYITHIVYAYINIFTYM